MSTGIPCAVAPPGPAFAKVYEAELAYVWRCLRRLGVPEADLEDAAHDAFVVVHRRLDDFDPGRPLKPWLAGIAVRVAADHRRRAHRRPERPDADLDPVDPRTAGAADRREARALLGRALEALGADRRTVLVLHDLEGLTMPEIAEGLDVPLNTLYSRLRLARRDLAAAVRHLHGGPWP